MKAGSLDASAQVGSQDCQRAINLWIHQDATDSFRDALQTADQYIPDLLNSLHDIYGADGFDFGLSLFRDRDETCFEKVTNFGGEDYQSKVTGAGQVLANARAIGGDRPGEDTFSALPYIVASQFVKVKQPGDVRLLMIITDDFAKYHGMLADWQSNDWSMAKWGEHGEGILMEEWQGDREFTDYDKKVTCSQDQMFLTMEQICKPLKDETVVPIMVTSDPGLGPAYDPETQYRWFFETCGLSEANKEVYFTRFEELETAKDAIMEVIAAAKCNAPTATPTAGPTTAPTPSPSTDTSTQIPTSATATESSSSKGGSIITPVIGASAGVAALLIAGLAYLKYKTRADMDVGEDAHDDFEVGDVSTDRETITQLDETQFEQ